MHCNPYQQWFFENLFLFDTLSCFASVDWRVFQCSKIGHARRLVYFTREITLKNEYLSQFWPDRKVLWMTSEQLFQIFIKLSIVDSSRAICVLLTINFWSHLGEERSEKTQKIHRHPSDCRIESIKSVGIRSQKDTLITYPRHFLETLISCRIYIPKNAILQVNSSETSLQVSSVFSSH